ncbi:hypothetical protein ACFOVU_19460 [Nocardiopsis sediminis]|uniref:DUF4190 domain-containing protein n=1 Tax=Nocardiopsis sediminis TaxID=1778267 RepID=A0ABV8FU23_9ACTN
MSAFTQAAEAAAGLRAAVVWNPDPQLPSEVIPPIEQLLAWGRGIIAVVGVLGVLYCAAKIVAARGGRADLAADGVSGLVWTLLGICLMLIAASVVMMLIAPPSPGDPGIVPI